MLSDQINYIIIHIDVLQYDYQKTRELLFRLANPSRGDVIIIYSLQKTKAQMQSLLRSKFEAGAISTQCVFITRTDFENKMSSSSENEQGENNIFTIPLAKILSDRQSNEQKTVKRVILVDHDLENLRSFSGKGIFAPNKILPIMVNQDAFRATANLLMVLPFFDLTHSALYADDQLLTCETLQTILRKALNKVAPEPETELYLHTTQIAAGRVNNLMVFASAQLELFFMNQSIDAYSNTLGRYKCALQIYQSIGDDSNSLKCLLKLIRVELFRHKHIEDAPDSDLVVLQYAIQIATILTQVGSILLSIVPQCIINEAQECLQDLATHYNTQINRNPSQANTDSTSPARTPSNVLQLYANNKELIEQAITRIHIKGEPEPENMLKRIWHSVTGAGTKGDDNKPETCALQ